MESVVATLVGEWAELDRLLTGLSTDAWAEPTCLPGWRVTDIVAHLIGTEAMLCGESAPPVEADVKALPHVRNELAVFNEHWVLDLAEEKPSAMLDRFRTLTLRRAEALAAKSREEFDAPSWTPKGQGTYGEFMHTRIYDCWMHEQDIRDAVGEPGNDGGPAAQASVDEVAMALGYIVGKRAAAPQGSTVVIELTGPVRRTLPVVVEDRARLVTEVPENPTVTVRMSSSVFMRLSGGRTTRRDGVTVTGDAELGSRLLDNIAFTI
jgi:uncharacterized protein (TIGR03083 family)